MRRRPTYSSRVEAPAKERALAPQGHTHLPDREAGIPAGWVERHCYCYGSYRCRACCEAVLAPQQDENAGANRVTQHWFDALLHRRKK